MTEEQSIGEEGTLRLVNENFRRVLREIADGKGKDKYALMDKAKLVLLENKQEVTP